MKENIEKVAFFENMPNETLTLRGLLIIMVIMDHNDFLRQFSPDLFRPLTSHVLGFLVLPFFLPARPLCRKFILDRLIRYFVPFWWALCVVSVIYFFLYGGKNGHENPFSTWFFAALLGSAKFVKTASGFYYLWFLPCLAGLVVFLTFYDSLSRRWQHVFLVPIIGWHIFGAVAIGDWYGYIPLGLPIVLWLFPIGLIFRFLVRENITQHIFFPALAGFIVSYTYLVFVEKNLEVMTLIFVPITDFVNFLMQEISAFSGVVVFMWLAAKLRDSRFLNACGEHSLLIYLIHPLILFGGAKFTGALEWKLEPHWLLLLGLFFTAGALLVSLLLSLAVERNATIKHWVTPRNLNDWGPVRLINSIKKFYRVPLVDK